MTTANDDIAKQARAQALELVKRIGGAHKASIGKVAHHLGLAKAAHAKGMASLKKAAGCMVAAHKLGKAVDGDAAGHMASAHENFSAAADHMDDMEAHLGKAMSAWGHDTATTASENVGGEITIPGLTELTEGHVPQYEADSEYGKLLKRIADGGLVTKEQAAEMAKQAADTAALKASNDALSKQVETLSRLPSGAPKVKIFDFDKTALPGGPGENDDVNKTRLGALLEGVDLSIENENDFTKAAGGMIANMIKNGPRFGKGLFGKPPMWDPTFHGRGGIGSSRG